MRHESQFIYSFKKSCKVKILCIAVSMLLLAINTMVQIRIQALVENAFK